jgi:two-component system C4-dicarboxylate transport sensor histidine kinase DctB
LDSLQALWRTGQPLAAIGLLPELEHEVHRLRTLIQRLRHLARSDPPRVTAVRLRTAIDDARKMFGPRMATAGVRCEESVGELWVQADAELLSLAITNLVVNAIDAMAGVDSKHISLRARQDDDALWVEMTIADNGPGLPAQVLEQLFKPFVTTKPADQGLGLGLALCAEYLAAMGAQIQGRNRPEGGAEFQLTLRSAG